VSDKEQLVRYVNDQINILRGEFHDALKQHKTQIESMYERLFNRMLSFQEELNKTVIAHEKELAGLKITYKIVIFLTGMVVGGLFDKVWTLISSIIK